MLLVKCFREHVKRTFATVASEVDKDQLESLFMKTINTAILDGSLLNTDWSREPLPMYVAVWLTLSYR